MVRAQSGAWDGPEKHVLANRAPLANRQTLDLDRVSVTLQQRIEEVKRRFEGVEDTMYCRCPRKGGRWAEQGTREAAGGAQTEQREAWPCK